MGQKLTIDEAAEKLRCSKRNIRRLISRGELRAFRIGSGSLIRIDTDDLAKVFKPVVPSGDHR